MSITGEILANAIPGSIALVFPALGELVSERAGVINLGTEGAMLAGALGGIATAVGTGNVWLGVVVSVLCGAAGGAVHATAVVLRGANQLASGLVVWFLALGITSVLGASYNGQVVPLLAAVAVPGLSSLPVIGPVVFDQNPLVYLGYVLVPAIWWFIHYTRTGLVLRASGERPAVVFAGGHRPLRVRFVAVCAGSDLMHPMGALVTGAIAGAIFVVMFTLAQNRWKIDDVLGVWPLHGLCGAWGGIAAGIFGSQALGGLGGVSLASQIVGTLLGVAIAGVGGIIVYGLLKATVGLRLDAEQEFDGADLAIHRISATPERETTFQ